MTEQIYKVIADEIYELMWETQDVEAIKKRLSEIVDEEHENFLNQNTDGAHHTDMR
jgi:hypothetical protein